MTNEELRNIMPAAILEACAKEESHYSITTPFWWKDWICATDGVVCLRLPRSSVTGEYTTPPENKYPPLDMLAWDDAYEAEPLPLPQDSVLENTTTECDHCFNGFRECDMGHEHECPECDGTGDVVHMHCAVWDRLCLAMPRVMRWKRYGAAFYRPVSKSPKAPCRLVFPGGGEGLLMPCDYSHANPEHVFYADLGFTNRVVVA